MHDSADGGKSEKRSLSAVLKKVVDLDAGAVIAAEVHPADEGDTTTLSGTPNACSSS